MPRFFEEAVNCFLERAYVDRFCDKCRPDNNLRQLDFRLVSSPVSGRCSKTLAILAVCRAIALKWAGPEPSCIARPGASDLSPVSHLPYEHLSIRFDRPNHDPISLARSTEASEPTHDPFAGEFILNGQVPHDPDQLIDDTVASAT